MVNRYQATIFESERERGRETVADLLSFISRPTEVDLVAGDIDINLSIQREKEMERVTQFVYVKC